MTTVCNKDVSRTSSTALEKVSTDITTTGDPGHPNDSLGAVAAPPAPSAAVLTVIALLGPEIFRRARDLRVVCAVILGVARTWELHVEAGYATLEEYAAAKFELTGSNFKQLLRAAKGVWRFFPAESQQVIDWMGSQVDGARLSDIEGISVLPPVSILRELEGAMESITDEDERGELLEGIKTGKVSHRDLVQVGKRKRAIALAVQGTTSAVAAVGAHVVHASRPVAASLVPTRTPAGSESDFAWTSSAAQIWDDVEDLAGATGNLVETCEILTGVLNYWAANPTFDVVSVTPRLRAVIQELETLAKVLRDTITPMKNCGRCRGKGGTGGSCLVCGGAGWLRRVPGGLDTTPSKPAKKAKAAGRVKVPQKKTTAKKPAAPRKGGKRSK